MVFFSIEHTEQYSCGLQGFPGVLIVVVYFSESFLLEVNFICRKFDSMAPFLDSLLANSCRILFNKGAIESDSYYIKSISHKKEFIKCPNLTNMIQVQDFFF